MIPMALDLATIISNTKKGMQECILKAITFYLAEAVVERRPFHPMHLINKLISQNPLACICQDKCSGVNRSIDCCNCHCSYSSLQAKSCDWRVSGNTVSDFFTS